MEDPLKIVVLTMNSNEVLWGKAIFNGDMLVMESPTRIPNKRSSVKQVARDVIQPLVENAGFLGLVDGDNKDIAQIVGSKHVDFTEPDTLSAAYIRYNEMNRQGMIFYPEVNPAAYQIPVNIVNAIRTPDGKLRYEFDWARIRGEHLLTLMMMHATKLPAQSRPGFLKAFCNFFRGDKSEEGTNITQARHTLMSIDERFQEEGRTKSMAGQQIDENSWYL